MIMNKRPSGYYMIKLDGEWEIAYWSDADDYWNNMFMSGSLEDKDLQEIIEERILMPDEKEVKL